jgi:GLPGLI family protein
MAYMKVLLFLISSMLISVTRLPGQAIRFLNAGVVEYEKTINMYGVIRKSLLDDNQTLQVQAFEQYRMSHTQFEKEHSLLMFSGNKTLFTPKDERLPQTFFSNLPFAKQDNIVFADYNTGQAINQKSIFEDIFLLKDSITRVKWKITDERRDIAGFHCRRANGLMMDSIYIVAFFTDEIQISAGPESFNGLPGLILGVVLPHEYVSWFAVSVISQLPADNFPRPPQKGKVITYKELVTTLKAASSNWGPHARGYLKSFLF